MGTVVYTLRDVIKTRSKGGVSFTLRVPELDIHRGEFCSVVGPSGCGKSTLLDMLALVLEPSTVARFRLNVPRHGGMEEYDIHGLPENKAARIRRDNIGYVLQRAAGLLSFLTVRENILLTAQIQPLTGQRQRVRPAGAGCWDLAINWRKSRSTSPVASGSGWRWPGP
jgi:putative ABC transport system ATP-binding protein